MFSPEKILHEIVYLLSLNGGRMNLLKLMKELYLIDRESIKERDTSVSGDVFFSMPHGPVLSQTLNLCNDLPNNSWAEYLEQIIAPYYPDIAIKKTLEPDLLSEKDKDYINEISAKFKDYEPKQLEDYTHKLAEWKNPHGSSRKIRYADVMKALGKTDEEILAAKEEYERFNALLSLSEV